MLSRTRTVAAACSIVATALVVAACGSSTPTETDTSAGAEIRTGESFDPTAFSGEEINLLLVEHPFVDSLEPLLTDFETQAGITVNVEVLNEDQAFDKIEADLSSGAGNYDVIMTDPLHNWKYAAAGWIDPLDSYLNNPAITSADYNPDDFVQGIFDAGRWTGDLLEGQGEGPLWALPINFESYNLTYRPSIFEQTGLEVPTTYEDVLTTVETLAEEGPGDVYPVVTRFDKYWDLTYLTFGSMAQSYGVTMLNDEGEVAIATPESVEATNMFLDIVKAGSPDSASSFTWYEVLQGMAGGRYAMALDESDLFAATYENEDESQIADDVGYAMIPEGPAGRFASAWIWQVSLNAGSDSKGAAWTFMQWLTSADTLLQTNLNGNMNPVRSSAWDSPELQELVDGWGAEPGQYREVLEQTAEIAAIRYPPHPELTRALDIWAGAIQQSYFDGNTEQNLQAAQEEIAHLLQLD